MLEGDFDFDAEFNAAVAETSTSDAGFIVADLSKKLAFASHALMQKAKAVQTFGSKAPAKG